MCFPSTVVRKTHETVAPKALGQKDFQRTWKWERVGGVGGLGLGRGGEGAFWGGLVQGHGIMWGGGSGAGEGGGGRGAFWGGLVQGHGIMWGGGSGAGEGGGGGHSGGVWYKATVSCGGGGGGGKRGGACVCVVSCGTCIVVWGWGGPRGLCA